MNDPLFILYTALVNRLNNVDPLWDTRVYSENALAGASRPYVLIFYSGGGELNAMKRRDAEFLISVKCVADTSDAAMTGASIISDYLNDKGLQDSPYDNVAAASSYGWTINTITQERRIQLTEQFENVAAVYHSGHQFRIKMEKNHG